MVVQRRIKSYRKILPSWLVRRIETNMVTFNRTIVQLIVNMVRKEDTEDTYHERASAYLKKITKGAVLSPEEARLLEEIIDWISQHITNVKRSLFE